MFNNNKRGELTLQGLLMGVLISGLFISIIVTMIINFGAGYNTDGFVEDDINPYNNMRNLSSVVQDANDDIDQVTPDPSAFDFFSDIFSKIITPFKFIYRSSTLLIGLAGRLTTDLFLLTVFKEFMITAITILVIVGIVMIKFHMGRSK